MSRLPLWLGDAGEEDVESLVDLERRCHTHPWSARSFREELGDPAHRRVLVLRQPFEAGEPGRGIVAYAAYRLIAGELHLLNLAVAPEHRRGGLGRFLLREVLAQGTRLGAERVLLEVRRSNLAALALYEGFGFVPLGARRGYYQGPPEDALVLVRGGTAVGAPSRETGS